MAPAAHSNWLGIALGVIVIALLSSRVGAQDAVVADRDDAAIYAAVIEHTLRAQFEKVPAARTPGEPMVRIVGRTMPACSETIDREVECFRVSDLASGALFGDIRARFDTLMPRGLIGGLLIDLAARNVTSTPLSSLSVPGVIVLQAGEYKRLQDRVAAGQPASYAAFSAPAYAGNWALAHATYTCGDACGSARIFLLEKTGAEWQVRGVEILWVRMDLCSMWDAPAPLGAVIGEFAALIALAAVAGVLRRSKVQITRWCGTVLFSGVVVLSILSSSIINNWGILFDFPTCTPFAERTTRGILIGFNLAVLGTGWLAGRHSRRVPCDRAV